MNAEVDGMPEKDLTVEFWAKTPAYDIKAETHNPLADLLTYATHIPESESFCEPSPPPTFLLPEFKPGDPHLGTQSLILQVLYHRPTLRFFIVKGSYYGRVLSSRLCTCTITVQSTSAADWRIRSLTVCVMLYTGGQGYSDSVFVDDAIRIEKYAQELKGSSDIGGLDISTNGSLSVHINGNTEGNGNRMERWLDYAVQW